MSANDSDRDHAANPGGVLRSIRAAKGWTLAEVKDLTGLSVSTLSKLENGKMGLTYDKLLKLGRGLGVDMADLLGGAPKGGEVPRLISGRRSITRKGEAQTIVTPTYKYGLYASELLHRSLHPMIVEVTARSVDEFEELTRHAGEEFAYVVEGCVDFHSELYAPTRLNEGDSIYFDAGMGHAYVAASPGPCKIISISTNIPKT